MDTQAFYPTDEQGVQEIRKVCLSCPVRPECREYAVANERFGVWAGTSERQRVRMRKERGITVPHQKVRTRGRSAA